MLNHWIRTGTVIAMLFGLVACSPPREEGVYTPAVSRLLEKAQALRAGNRLNEAICRMEAAGDLAPNTYEVQYNLGILYTEAKRWSDAVTALQAALKQKPTDPNALFSLGLAYESLADEGEQVAAGTVASPPPPEGTMSPTEARQQALAAYEKFLQVAPEQDPKRPDAESAVAALKS